MRADLICSPGYEAASVCSCRQASAVHSNLAERLEVWFGVSSGSLPPTGLFKQCVGNVLLTLLIPAQTISPLPESSTSLWTS